MTRIKVNFLLPTIIKYFCVYIKHLLYLCFDNKITVMNSLPVHTNSNGYCVPKKNILSMRFQDLWCTN